ncbi:hypothetical protein FJTKL_00658 [Diaporthe vaccinii]|uniref:Uncharacterized protein n=1 Tax=Diaporthe vaccinii TaxID=105482 RepID=A0ABR4F651_9PEZI
MSAFGVQGSAIELRIRPVACGPWPAHAGSQSSKDLPPQESDSIKVTRIGAEAVIVNRNITVRIFVIYTLQCAMYACMCEVPGPSGLLFGGPSNLPAEGSRVSCCGMDIMMPPFLLS